VINRGTAVLFNPSSGKGRSLKQKEKIQALLRAGGIDYDFFISQSEAHLERLAAETAANYPVVAGIGGDTTFNIMAREILKLPDPPVLGMIGAGSANDIVRGLGIPRIEDACKAIARGTVKKMDLGCLKIKRKGTEESQFFLGTVSAGLGASVNLYVEDYYRRRPILAKINPLAQLTAGLLGIGHSFKSKELPMKAAVRTLASTGGEGVTREIEFSLLVFLNTPYYANGLKLGREGGLFDGELDCRAINTRSFRGTLGTAIHMWRAARGSDMPANVTLLHSPSFQISPPAPMDIQVDGDIIRGVEQLEISLLPGRLKVLSNS
jgi:diacylglycerol kinase family enzyme